MFIREDGGVVVENCYLHLRRIYCKVAHLYLCSVALERKLEKTTELLCQYFYCRDVELAPKLLFHAFVSKTLPPR